MNHCCGTMTILSKWSFVVSDTSVAEAGERKPDGGKRLFCLKTRRLEPLTTNYIHGLCRAEMTPVNEDKQRGRSKFTAQVLNNARTAVASELKPQH